MENQKELTMNEETLFIKWLIDRVSHDFIKGKLRIFPDNFKRSFYKSKDMKI